MLQCRKHAVHYISSDLSLQLSLLGFQCATRNCEPLWWVLWFPSILKRIRDKDRTWCDGSLCEMSLRPPSCSRKQTISWIKPHPWRICPSRLMWGCYLKMLKDLAVTISLQYIHHYSESVCPALSGFLCLLSFFSSSSVKQKNNNNKILSLRCPWLKQIGSYYVAVSLRLFCSGLVVPGNP